MTAHLATTEEVLENPCVHNYLKEAIKVFLSKDPVDAAADAELLAEIMKNRMQSFIKVASMLALVVALYPADIPLQTAGQQTAPTCIEFCEGGNS